MANEIWVKVANPRAHFYQEVLKSPESGSGPMRLVSERVFAPTFLEEGHPDHGVQIAVPMKVTDSPAVRNALRETYPLSATDQQIVPASIIQCMDDEVQAYEANPWHRRQHQRDTDRKNRLDAAEQQAKLAADPRTEIAELRARIDELEAARGQAVDDDDEPETTDGGDGSGGDGEGAAGERSEQPRTGGRFASKKAAQ